MLIKKNEFSEWVEKTRVTSKQNFIDTVLMGCEEFKIDTERVKALLSDQIISKIKAEAIDMHCMKSSSKSLKAFL